MDILEIEKIISERNFREERHISIATSFKQWIYDDEELTSQEMDAIVSDETSYNDYCSSWGFYDFSKLPFTKINEPVLIATSKSGMFNHSSYFNLHFFPISEIKTEEQLVDFMTKDIIIDRGISLSQRMNR